MWKLSRVERVLAFLKDPDLHPLPARYFAGPPRMFCVLDAFMLARGGTKNAATLQLRRIMAAHTYIPFEKHNFYDYSSCKVVVATFTNTLVFLSKLRGAEGVFFGEALAAHSPDQTPPLTPHEPSSCSTLTASATEEATAFDDDEEDEEDEDDEAPYDDPNAIGELHTLDVRAYAVDV